MGTISSLRSISKRFLYTSISTETFISCQDRRFYTRFRPPQQFTKSRESKGSPSVYKIFPSYCFSTMNSKSKVGFVGWYLGKLDSRPIVTKTATTSLIFAAADLTAQMLSQSSGSFDLIRTARMAVYGLLILGPSQHLWFNIMSKAFPKRDVLTTLKKTFMGQAIFGPVNATVFFSYNAALQGERGDEIISRLKRDVIPTLRNGLMYWPICDFVAYKYVPVHLQYMFILMDDLFDLHGKSPKSEHQLEWYDAGFKSTACSDSELVMSGCNHLAGYRSIINVKFITFAGKHSLAFRQSDVGLWHSDRIEMQI